MDNFIDCENMCRELDEALADLGSTMEQAGRARGVQRADLLERATNQHKKAKRELHHLKIDARGLSNPEKQDFLQRHATYDRELKKLNGRISELKGTEEAEEVPGKSRARNEVHKKVDEIGAIQIETINALTEGARTVTKSQAEADRSVIELRRQRDELDATRQELKELEGNVKRARREMQAFMRRMMSDKLILVMMFLAVLGIIGMIAFRIVQMGKKK